MFYIFTKRKKSVVSGSLPLTLRDVYMVTYSLKVTVRQFVVISVMTMLP